MADGTVTIDEDAIFVLLSPAIDGLEDLANKVAVSARARAPVGSRTPNRAREISLEFRLVERRPPGRSDYVREKIGDTPVDYEEDVARFVMGEIGKRDSGLYQVYGSIPSSNRRAKTVQYPLLNARAITKPGKMVSRLDPLSDVQYHERERVPTKLVTGKHLKDSITVDIVNYGQTKWTAVVLADRPYAYYVEKGLGPGKSKRTAAHFMENALAEHAGDIESGKIFKR